MDIYIDRDELLRGLARVQTVIDRKATNTVLTCVHIQTVDRGLRLTGSDTESAIVLTVPATINKPGAACVEGANVFGVVRSLAGEAVGLKTDAKNKLTIEAGRSKFKLPGFDPADYPAVPNIDGPASLETSETVLRSLAERVSPCVSQDDVQYGLNGAHMEATEDGLRWVSTDGRRLAAVAGKFEGFADLPQRSLVPRKALAALRKLLDGDARVGLSFADGAMQVTRGSETFWFRLVEGVFPDYRAIIPPEWNLTVTLRRDDVLGALKRAALLTVDAKAARVRIGDTEATVSVHNVDRGDVEEAIPCEASGTPDMLFGVNVKYLAEVVGATAGERIELRFVHALAPVQVSDPDDASASFIIMPMRVD